MSSLYQRHPDQKPAWLHDHFAANTHLSGVFADKMAKILADATPEHRASICQLSAADSPGWGNVDGTTEANKPMVMVNFIKAFQACGLKVLITHRDEQKVDSIAALYFSHGQQAGVEQHATTDVPEYDVRACLFVSLWNRSMLDEPDNVPPHLYEAMDKMTVEAGRPGSTHLPYSSIERKLKYIQRLAATPAQEDGMMVAQVAAAKEYLSLRDRMHDQHFSAEIQPSIVARFRALNDDFTKTFLTDELDVVFVSCDAAASPQLMDHFRPDVWIQDVDYFRKHPQDWDDEHSAERLSAFIPLNAFKKHVKFVVDFGAHDS